MTEVLVLDSTCRPVSRVGWEQAIAWVCSSRVEVIESYEDKVVRSVTLSLPVPSVVRFLRGRHKRGVRPIRFTRENVLARDRSRCQYCGVLLARPEATFDHVVPRAQGGATGWENVVIACVDCNQRKGGRTPAQARMRLRTAPARPTWLPDEARLTLGWEKGMPASWRSWIRDVSYWNGELER